MYMFSPESVYLAYSYGQLCNPPSPVAGARAGLQQHLPRGGLISRSNSSAIIIKDQISRWSATRTRGIVLNVGHGHDERERERE